MKAILARSYHLVLGGQGTGKTDCIVTLIKILAKMKKRVLLVHSSNQVVDRVLVKLKQSGFKSFVRLASSSPIIEESIRENVKSSSSFRNMPEIA